MPTYCTNYSPTQSFQTDMNRLVIGTVGRERERVGIIIITSQVHEKNNIIKRLSLQYNQKILYRL